MASLGCLLRTRGVITYDSSGYNFLKIFNSGSKDYQLLLWNERRNSFMSVNAYIYVEYIYGMINDKRREHAISFHSGSLLHAPGSKLLHFFSFCVTFLPSQHPVAARISHQWDRVSREPVSHWICPPWPCLADIPGMLERHPLQHTRVSSHPWWHHGGVESHRLGAIFNFFKSQVVAFIKFLENRGFHIAMMISMQRITYI